MGKWLRNQRIKGDNRRWTIFVKTKEREKPSGKLAEGSSFFEVFQSRNGTWNDKVPKFTKNIGWARLKKVM